MVGVRMRCARAAPLRTPRSAIPLAEDECASGPRCYRRSTRADARTSKAKLRAESPRERSSGWLLGKGSQELVRNPSGLPGALAAVRRALRGRQTTDDERCSERAHCHIAVRRHEARVCHECGDLLELVLDGPRLRGRMIDTRFGEFFPVRSRRRFGARAERAARRCSRAQPFARRLPRAPTARRGSSGRDRAAGRRGCLARKATAFPRPRPRPRACPSWGLATRSRRAARARSPPETYASSSPARFLAQR